MRLRETFDLVVGRTLELAAIPAPPLEESDRADLVRRWLTHEGFDPTVDSVGNVRAQIRDGYGEGTVVCAHLDTAFDRDTPHDTSIVGDRLYGPSVGDDSVGVAALTVLSHVLPADLGMPLWVAATVGEEGLGNLHGAHHLFRHPPLPLLGVVALEGNYLGRVVHRGVGSVRWMISLDGPGGHAWEAADAPSAVHAAGRLIAALDALAADTSARWSLNIGLVSGGEAVNARARHAQIYVDLRSEDPDTLADLSAQVLALTDRVSQVASVATEVGRRPAGSIPSDHRLVRAAVLGLSKVGRTAQHPSASTDANAAYDAGIPAVTVGITTGSGEHTPEEWIDLPPIEEGVLALAETIAAFSRGEDM